MAVSWLQMFTTKNILYHTLPGEGTININFNKCKHKTEKHKNSVFQWTTTLFVTTFYKGVLSGIFKRTKKSQTIERHSFSLDKNFLL